MNRILERLVEEMRNVQGTPLEPPRNGLLFSIGWICDQLFAARQLRDNERATHPLMDIIRDQMGEPTDVWDVGDVTSFRLRFSELLDYLPFSVPKGVSVSEPARCEISGLSYIRVEPTDVRSEAVMIYLHGGGFVLGSARDCLPEAAELSGMLGVETLVVDYELAPEVKYPRPQEGLAQFIRERVGSRSYYIVGESAGGGLGAILGASAGELESQCLAACLLYPWLDLQLDSHSMRRLGRGQFLTRHLLEVFRDYYLQPGATDYARVSPIHAIDVDRMPPTLCIVGQCDPLIDDSVMLVQRMRAAHRVSELWIEPGMLHGYVSMRGMLASRGRALRLAADFLSRY